MQQFRWHLLLLLALLAGFATAAPTTQAQTSNVVTAGAGVFRLNNQNYRFVGANLRRMVYMTSAEQDVQITSLRQMGARVVRVYAARSDQSPTQIIANLKSLLNKVGTGDDLKFIISLTDFYQNSSFYLGADAGSYDSNGYLTPAWFQTGYTTSYRSYVQQVVSDSQLNSDPRIFAWELGNELQAGSATDMLNFATTMGCAIQGWDQNHMVSTGFLSTWHATRGGTGYVDDFNAITCGANGRAFDYGSIHGYNNSWVNPQCAQAPCPEAYHYGDQDYSWWQANQVPYVLGELGFSNISPCGAFTGGSLNGTPIPSAAGSRASATEATLDAFFSRFGAAGTLQWGFRAGQGDFDNDCLSMTQSSSDWQALFDLYRRWSTTLKLPAIGANLVQNGDFSQNLTGWNPIQAVGTETCCGGGYPAYPEAFAHPNGAGSNLALWQNIPSPQAGTYVLQGAVRTSGGTQQALIQADNGVSGFYCRTPITATEQWQVFACTFTLSTPQTIHVALVATNGSAQSGGWIVWDSIHLSRPGSGFSGTISSATPAPPACVYRTGTLAQRTLVFSGSGFPYPRTNQNVQFRRVNTGATSIHFGMEVTWTGSTQISIDMDRIDHLLWSKPKLALQARLTAPDSSGAQIPFTDWSPQFYLASQGSCP